MRHASTQKDARDAVDHINFAAKLLRPLRDQETAVIGEPGFENTPFDAAFVALAKALLHLAKHTRRSGVEANLDYVVGYEREALRKLWQVTGVLEGREQP